MTAEKQEANTAIVIGAGLAGLSLSLGLIQQGFYVQIVEKSHDFSRTGATFGLAPNGRKALDELCPGVAEEMSKLGVTMSTGGTMLGWWNVRDVLLDRVLKEKKKITLHTGWMIQNIDNDDAVVKATFEKRMQDPSSKNKGEIMTLSGCFLVGADGVNSAVRNMLKLPPPKDTGISVWRSRVKVPEESTGAANVLRPYLDIPVAPIFQMHSSVNYALFNWHPKLPRTMAIVINYQVSTPVPTGTSPKSLLESKSKDEKELKEVQAILECADTDGITHPVRMKVVELPEEDSNGWGGIGRITLTGDAAHGKLDCTRTSA